ncbi:MAG: WD40 repeat domain-containing protein [Acidimicrobiales bacterium]
MPDTLSAPSSTSLSESVAFVDWHPFDLGLAAAGLDGEVVIVAPDGTESRTRHESPCTALRWSPLGTDLAVGHRDGTVRIISIERIASVELRYRSPIWSIDWAPDATAIAVGAGSDVSVHEAADGGLIDEFCFLPGAVTALCWAPGPGNLAVGTSGGVRWFDVGGEGPPDPVATIASDGIVTALRRDPHSRFLALSNLNGSIEIHDLWSGDVFGIDGFVDRVRDLEWSPRSDRLVFAVDLDVVVWPRDHEGPADEPLCTIGHTDTVTTSALHPSGRWIASAAADGSCLLSETSSGRPILDWRHEGSVRAMSWNNAGDRLACGTSEGDLVIASAALPDPSSPHPSSPGDDT